MIPTQAIVSSLIFAVIGIAILVLTFWIVEKITPENLWREIIDKKNTALALMASAFMIAIAIIIASAIH